MEGTSGARRTCRVRAGWPRATEDEGSQRVRAGYGYGQGAEAGCADAHLGLPGGFLASSFPHALEDGG